MLAAALSLMLGVCDLSRLFADGAAGWRTPADRFVARFADDGFVFADAARGVANDLRRGGCVWHGLEVWETRVYYNKEGKAERVEMSLYNRGDDRDGEPLAGPELDALLAKVAAALGGKGGATERKKLRSGGYRSSRTFANGGVAAELVWGVDSLKAREQTADYVRVTLAPVRGRGAAGAGASAGRRADPRANVRRSDAGDVWIDGVPMVDQGQKGYCAAAVAERVLRYYGHPIDEHEMAQLAGTTAEGGTDTRAGIEAVKAVASRCRLGFQEIVSLGGSVQAIQKEVEQYNKAAKAMREPPIDLAACTVGHTIMVSAIRERMKPEVLLRMRTKDARFRKFLAGVRTQVDAGRPVFWGVTLGLFPEEGLPQSQGGHMRLVIGYNERTHEILYTDSWGAGHELKRMPEDRAFAITHDAFALRPL